MRASQLGETASATHWLQLLVAIQEDGSPEDRESRRIAESALRDLGAGLEPSRDGAVHHMIDRYWVDPSGTYVDGWIHLDGDPGTGLWLEIDGRRVPLPRHRRDDLLAFWPDSSAVVEAGFEAYVPGSPRADLDFIIATSHGEQVFRIAAPATRLPVPQRWAQDESTDRMAELLEQAPDGPALVVGGRLPESDSPSLEGRLLAGREVIGLDIHPGHAIDVVGDAHRLSEVLGVDRFAIVYSASLFEHLTKPWVAAREVARVLKVGGVALHSVPWAWPAHAEPNDFWRMSEWGLRELFGEELGFEVLDSGRSGSVSMVPDPSWREHHPTMPTLDTGSMAWIVVRKVDHRANKVVWPYDADRGAEIARAYPIDGLATTGRDAL